MPPSQPELLSCSACEVARPKVDYSKSQLAKRSQRRCNSCVQRHPPQARQQQEPELHVCSSCGTAQPKAHYSGTQLGKGPQRRCTACVQPSRPRTARRTLQWNSRRATAEERADRDTFIMAAVGDNSFQWARICAEADERNLDAYEFAQFDCARRHADAAALALDPGWWCRNPVQLRCRECDLCVDRDSAAPSAACRAWEAARARHSRRQAHIHDREYRRMRDVMEDDFRAFLSEPPPSPSAVPSPLGRDWWRAARALPDPTPMPVTADVAEWRERARTGGPGGQPTAEQAARWRSALAAETRRDRVLYYGAKGTDIEEADLRGLPQSVRKAAAKYVYHHLGYPRGYGLDACNAYLVTFTYFLQEAERIVLSLAADDEYDTALLFLKSDAMRSAAEPFTREAADLTAEMLDCSDYSSDSAEGEEDSDEYDDESEPHGLGYAPDLADVSLDDLFDASAADADGHDEDAGGFVD